MPSAVAKQLCKIKNKKENHGLVELIRVTWSNLKDKIEHMSKTKKKKNEKPDKISKIAEEILTFNRKKHSGQGSRTLTPNQMLSRLPITLAQSKAGNNLENLKMR